MWLFPSSFLWPLHISVRQEHFLEVVGGQEFLLLPVEEMERLLASDDVNVQDEETVVMSLLTWVSHDAATRERHLPLLLVHIRLPLLQPQVSAATVISLSKTMWMGSFVTINLENCHRKLQLPSAWQSFIRNLCTCPSQQVGFLYNIYSTPNYRQT